MIVRVKNVILFLQVQPTFLFWSSWYGTVRNQPLGKRAEPEKSWALSEPEKSWTLPEPKKNWALPGSLFLSRLPATLSSRDIEYLSWSQRWSWLAFEGHGLSQVNSDKMSSHSSFGTEKNNHVCLVLDAMIEELRDSSYTFFKVPVQSSNSGFCHMFSHVFLNRTPALPSLKLTVCPWK